MWYLESLTFSCYDLYVSPLRLELEIFFSTIYCFVLKCPIDILTFHTFQLSLKRWTVEMRHWTNQSLQLLSVHFPCCKKNSLHNIFCKLNLNANWSRSKDQKVEPQQKWPVETSLFILWVCWEVRKRGKNWAALSSFVVNLEQSPKFIQDSGAKWAQSVLSERTGVAKANLICSGSGVMCLSGSGKLSASIFCHVKPFSSIELLKYATGPTPHQHI